MNTIPPVIPPQHGHRTLVLCFDGTGDQFDDDNSNIVQLFSMLRKDAPSQQMVYYQAGIGTYASPSSFLLTSVAKTLDQAVALYLDTHVKEGYQFLMQNYMAGDYICLFGFSRGAYTARALAGMLHKVGLLPRDNFNQIPFAWDMYMRSDEQGWAQSAAFKKAFSIDVDIQFVGVFDTVCSVGMFGKTLPFTTSNYAIRYFRHALALDERRAKFKANTWNKPTPDEEMLGTDASERMRRIHKLEMLEHIHSSSADKPTDILEVWFAGCHCDVGGGSVSNSTPNSLARVPLRWMIRQCFLTNSGIMFDSDDLAAIGLNPAHLYPVVKPASSIISETFSLFKSPSTAGAQSNGHDKDATLVGGETSPPTTVKGKSSSGSTSKTLQLGPLDTTTTTTDPVNHDHTPVLTLVPKSESEETLKDTLSAVYDQLMLRWFWWILELLPMRHKYQKPDKTWGQYLSMNLGRPREILKQDSGYFVHRSVQLRMETGYKPKAAFNHPPTWID